MKTQETLFFCQTKKSLFFLSILLRCLLIKHKENPKSSNFIKIYNQAKIKILIIRSRFSKCKMRIYKTNKKNQKIKKIIKINPIRFKDSSNWKIHKIQTQLEIRMNLKICINYFFYLLKTNKKLMRINLMNRELINKA